MFWGHRWLVYKLSPHLSTQTCENNLLVASQDVKFLLLYFLIYLDLRWFASLTFNDVLRVKLLHCSSNNFSFWADLLMFNWSAEISLSLWARWARACLHSLRKSILPLYIFFNSCCLNSIFYCTCLIDGWPIRIQLSNKMFLLLMNLPIFLKRPSKQYFFSSGDTLEPDVTRHSTKSHEL